MHLKQAMRRLLIEVDGSICFYCRKTVSDDLPNGHPDRATLEHRRPVSKRGGHHLDNMKISCSRCNAVKGNQSEAQFLRFIQTPQGKLKMAIADMTGTEKKHIEKYVSHETGRYLESLGKDTWRDLTREEWDGFLMMVISCWEERPQDEIPF